MVVFLDFLGVALVVPLLTSYFRDAGINTKLLGILSSIYSISQIFGGVVMGLLSDTQSKHNILMISLLGSSFSYFIIGSSKNVLMLFFSRILVGLVKQTYTIATTVVNEITDSSPELRSQELGRLSSISTVSFIVGPSLGSLLYSRVSKAAPAQAAACCFLLNAAICVLFIPRTGVMAATSNRNREEIDTDKKKSGASSIYLTFSAPYNLFKRQFADLSCIPNVIPVIMIRLAVLFVEVSMSSRHIVNYYENRFGLPTSSLGYMSTATAGNICGALTCMIFDDSIFASAFLFYRLIPNNIFNSMYTYSLVIGMVIQTLLLNPILKFFGGNSSTIVIAMSMMAVCGFLEGIAPSYLFFVVFSQVPGVIASSLLSASLRNVFSNTVPSKHMGKSLGKNRNVV